MAQELIERTTGSPPTSCTGYGVMGRVGVALALVVGLLGGAPAGGQAQEVGLSLGTQAPDAAVQDLQGNPEQLLTYLPAGKPAMIEFWAVWCGECEALQPQLDRIHARYGDQLTMVMVAVGVAQTLRRVNRYVEANAPGYAFVWDANGAAVRAYEAPTTSMVVLLDETGRVTYTGVGSDQDLIAAVERLFAGN